jgi:hypothetical protein
MIPEPRIFAENDLRSSYQLYLLLDALVRPASQLEDHTALKKPPLLIVQL